MNKTIKWGLSLILAAVGLSSAANAQIACHDTATPGTYQIDQYQVNVREIGLCKDSSCAQPASVISSQRAVNIANASDLTAPFAPADIPVGTYTHMRIVMAASITVAGKLVLAVPGGGGAQQVCVSKAGMSGAGVIVPSPAWVSGPDATPQAMTISIPPSSMTGVPGVSFSGGNMQIIVALASNLEVTEGGTFPDIDLQFTAVRDAFGMSGIWQPGSGVFACSAAIGTPSLKMKLGSASYVNLMPTSVDACTVTNSALSGGS